MPRLLLIPKCGTIDLDKVESVSNLKCIHPNLLDSDTILAYEIVMVSGKTYRIEEDTEILLREDFLKLWEG